MGAFFWAYSGIGIAGISQKNCSFSCYSDSRVVVKPFIVTLLTGSDMSVINSGPKRKNYSDHSSYSYSGIGPKERALNLTLLTLFLTFVLCRTHRVLSKYSYFIFYYFKSDKHQKYLPLSFLQQLYLLH